jgi:hypothetical protein
VSGSENFQSGPHASQIQSSSDNTEFAGNDFLKSAIKCCLGELNRPAGAYQFVDGYNYTQHLNPSKGNYFAFRSKPFKG